MAAPVLVSAAIDKSAAENPGNAPAAILALEMERDRERLAEPIDGDSTGVVVVVVEVSRSDMADNRDARLVEASEGLLNSYLEVG